MWILPLQCTATCGNGAQKRSAVCADSHGQEVDSSYCSEKDIVTERMCNTQPCPLWRVLDWTGCSVTCGHGHRHRKIICYIGDEDVIETKCDYSQKPTNKLDCYMGTCPRWINGEWGEVCSQSDCFFRFELANWITYFKDTSNINKILCGLKRYGYLTNMNW